MLQPECKCRYHGTMNNEHMKAKYLSKPNIGCVNYINDIINDIYKQF
jgi:hypothetical protein